MVLAAKEQAYPTSLHTSLVVILIVSSTHILSSYLLVPRFAIPSLAVLQVQPHQPLFHQGLLPFLLHPFLFHFIGHCSQLVFPLALSLPSSYPLPQASSQFSLLVCPTIFLFYPPFFFSFPIPELLTSFFPIDTFLLCCLSQLLK